MAGRGMVWRAARSGDLECAGTRLREEIARRQAIEAELRMKNKLESLGRLAAGVAHEINNPAQWADLSLKFVRRALPDLIAAARQSAPDFDAQLADVTSALDDLGEGLGRITQIVLGMKQLSHPGRAELAAVDVNQTLSAALTVCRSAYLPVAEMSTDLGEIPAVLGNASDLGQTFVNLIINAADAIRESVAASHTVGKLSVRTYLDGGWVVAAIQDSGPGIPHALKNKVFEPFFTTKDVGRGTGQGLAIARAIVVDKHHGQLSFESQAGQGTTFTVRLRPVEAQA